MLLQLTMLLKKAIVHDRNYTDRKSKGEGER